MLNINRFPGSFESIANLDLDFNYGQYMGDSQRLENIVAAEAARVASDPKATAKDKAEAAAVAALTAQTEQSNRNRHWQIENGYPD